MIHIKTERLIIRDHIASDIEAFHSLYTDQRVMHFIPSLLSKSLADSEKSLLNAIAEIDASPRTKYFFAIMRNEQYVGEIGFTLLNTLEEPLTADLGYFIKPEFWGNGYVTEAARAVVAVAFDQVGVNRIISGCNAKNSASESIMKKLGMTQIAHYSQHSLLDGEWCDRVCYEIMKV